MQDLLTAVRESRAWACYDCGKCTAACPIARIGGSLSPRRHVLKANSGQQKEILQNGTLFSCLTCRMCDQRCPATVAYTDLIQKLRALAFRGGVEPECPHGGALQSLMRMMAKGETHQDRLRWLSPDLKSDPEKGEVFYWTGCNVYYDAFFSDFPVATLKGTKAAVGLMNKLGVVPVVSADERCCGHDLLWNGDRKHFELLAQHNVKLLEASGAQTLVTSCAECLRTWKIDYEPFFSSKPPRMLHISEFLAEHLQELKNLLETRSRRREEADSPSTPDGNIDLFTSTAAPSPQVRTGSALESKTPTSVTFQDPCRLGRHLGIYDPPRQVLSVLPGIKLAEMRNRAGAALCCAGGTWSNCDRFAKQIQVERLREARATGASVLVTACPKCQIHFRCAMKDPRLRGETEIEMKDVSEVVAEAIAQAFEKQVRESCE
ncbi:MAG: (Fe-S)-binding protein [Verrucomicrobia bacterium]|nr:(Fe-S)-binding protein [Verrucomicrobiota bacterium]